MTTVTIHYISKIIFARRFRFVRCLLKMKNNCFQKYKLSKREMPICVSLKNAFVLKTWSRIKLQIKETFFSFSDRSLSKA
jgi:hypothetical protein